MQTQEPVLTVIDMQWPASLPADMQQHCAQCLEKYAARLLDGLDVPGGLKIEWHAAATAPLAMLVNGLPARLPYALSALKLKEASEYAELLCDSLLTNRELLVTENLVQSLAHLKNRFFLHFSPDDRQRAVRRLFSLGFSLERLNRPDIEPESAEGNPEEWAEAFCSELDDTSFQFFGHPEQIEPDDDPNDLNRLIEAAPHLISAFFQIKGIPAPRLQGVIHEELAPTEVFFRINDLYLPVRTLAAPFELFMRVLNRYGYLFVNAGLVDFLLDSLESTHPNLMVIARARFKNTFVANVLRGLAEENISIRPLTHILEILICALDAYEQGPGEFANPPLSENTFFMRHTEGFTGQDAGNWVELVRLNLKNVIINKALAYFDDYMTMKCFHLYEDLAEAIDRDDIPETSRESIFDDLYSYQTTQAGRQRPLVVQASMRRKVHEWLQVAFPDMPVFSYQECWPSINAQNEMPLAL